jgi:hypothetical protein
MKPSRWQPDGTRWREPGDWHDGWGEADEQAARYYRRLCAHYIGEARRWMKIAIEASDALYSSGRDGHPMEDAERDTLPARMAAAEMEE